MQAPAINGRLGRQALGLAREPPEREQGASGRINHIIGTGEAAGQAAQAGGEIGQARRPAEQGLPRLLTGRLALGRQGRVMIQVLEDQFGMRLAYPGLISGGERGVQFADPGGDIPGLPGKADPFPRAAQAMRRLPIQGGQHVAPGRREYAGLPACGQVPPGRAVAFSRAAVGKANRHIHGHLRDSPPGQFRPARHGHQLDGPAFDVETKTKPAAPAAINAEHQAHARDVASRDDNLLRPRPRDHMIRHKKTRPGPGFNEFWQRAESLSRHPRTRPAGAAGW